MASSRVLAFPTREPILPGLAPPGRCAIIEVSEIGRFRSPWPTPRRRPPKGAFPATKPVPKTTRRRLCCSMGFGRMDLLSALAEEAGARGASGRGEARAWKRNT